MRNPIASIIASSRLNPWLPSEDSPNLLSWFERGNESYGSQLLSVANLQDTAFIASLTPPTGPQAPFAHRTMGGRSIYYVSTSASRLVGTFSAPLAQPFTAIGVTYIVSSGFTTWLNNQPGGPANARVSVNMPAFPGKGTITLDCQNSITSGPVIPYQTPIFWAVIADGANSSVFVGDQNGLVQVASGNAGLRGLTGISWGSLSGGSQNIQGVNGVLFVRSGAASVPLLTEYFRYCQKFGVLNQCDDGMFAGNSFTVGIGASGNVGYRQEFYELVNSAPYTLGGKSIRLVGPFTAAGFPNANHGGVSGETCSQVAARVAGYLGGTYASTRLMMLEYVTNDIIAGSTPAVAAQAWYDGILTIAGAGHPDMQFVVSNGQRMLPADPDAAAMNACIALLPDKVAQLRALGIPIEIVDLADGIPTDPALYSDTIHYNAAGYTLAGHLWVPPTQTAIAAVP